MAVFNKTHLSRPGFTKFELSRGVLEYVFVFCIVSLPLWAQEKTPSAKVPPEKNDKTTISVFFQSADPKQLFQRLSEAFHVQFDEGANTVTEPITFTGGLRTLS